MIDVWSFQSSNSGYGDLAATSATLLIASVDSAELAGWVAIPFLLHCSVSIPPPAVHSIGGRE